MSDPLALHRATLLRARPETWRGQVIEIALPSEIADEWQAPGQYCMLALGPEQGDHPAPSPFVIANAPGGPGEGLLFYIQRSGPFTEALSGLRPGDPIWLTAPQGPGFPLAEMRQSQGPVLLATNGSGLAGVRGLMRHLVAAGRRVTLFQSCRHPGDFPFLADLLHLKDQGADVRLALTGGDPHWTGRRGRIQHLIAEATDLPEDLADGWVILCGVPAMQHEVAQWAMAQGVPPERICTNH